MKKDDILKAIDNVDDELISEAASRPSKISYRTKIRIMRTAMIGAAAAAMLTTGVLLYKFIGSAPADSDDNTAYISAEDESSAPVTSVQEPAGSNSADEPESLQDGETTEEPAVSYPEGIISMKYTSFTGAYQNDIWIDCTQQQADSWLGYIGSLILDEVYAEVDFASAGPLLRIYYSDGTFEQYQLQAPYLIITDRTGYVVARYDNSGNAEPFMAEVTDAVSAAGL